MEIKAEYLEIINRLAKSKKKIEMTHALEIKRYISPAKTKKIIEI